MHCGQCIVAYNPQSNNIATGSKVDFSAQFTLKIVASLPASVK